MLLYQENTLNTSPPPIHFFDFKSTDPKSGKLLLSKCIAVLGAELASPDWLNRSSPEWEYNMLLIGKVAIPVGISTGGVISFEGDPFTKKDRLLNITPAAVIQSISEQIALRAREHF